MTRGYGTPKLGYKYNYRSKIASGILYPCSQDEFSFLSSTCSHISSQCLTAALMAFQILKMGHFLTIPQRLALWLLLSALITFHCLENLEEPVCLLAGPTQTPLVVRNGCIHVYIYIYSYTVDNFEVCCIQNV